MMIFLINKQQNAYGFVLSPFSTYTDYITYSGTQILFCVALYCFTSFIIIQRLLVGSLLLDSDLLVTALDFY